MVESSTNNPNTNTNTTTSTASDNDPVTAEPTITPDPSKFANDNLPLIPQLAFGLYQVPDNDEGVEIIRAALAAGYRHLDGGEFYGNEAALGRALRASTVHRSELFVTGKVWKDHMTDAATVQRSVRASLAKIGLDYFDLMLIHWPVPGRFIQAYQALQELHAAGLCRALGLSNFTPAEYDALMRSGVVTVPPVCNQLEVSPAMYRPEIIDFYQRQQGMVVIAFKPLQRGALLGASGNEPYASMAQKYNITIPQLLLKWAVQHGWVVASKTSQPARMAENRNLWHFTLTPDDMSTLDGLTTAEDIQQRARREEASKQV